jgi:hypothetical protein
MIRLRDIIQPGGVIIQLGVIILLRDMILLRGYDIT